MNRKGKVAAVNLFFRSLKKNKRAMFGLSYILLEIIAVLFIPVIFRMDPYTSDIGAGFLAEPGIKHWMGTDAAGRDLLSRTIYGGRVSLLVGILSTLISVCIGLPLGLLAGYYRGLWETVVMRAADIFMSFPSMILILVLVSVVGPSLITVIVIIGVMGWTSIAKLIYGNVLSISKKEYIEAARAVGKSNLSIIFSEILPNAAGPVWVILSFRVGGAILTESGLSFLGVGVQAPRASWGNLINAAQTLSNLMLKPWMWIPPGFLIIFTVISFNFLGEGVRDALDPKMKLS